MSWRLTVMPGATSACGWARNCGARGWPPAHTSQDQFARELGFDRTVIVKAETGARPPSDDMAARIAEMFPDLCNGLYVRLAGIARKSNGPIPGWFADWVEIEAKATSLRWWEPLLIPGLLQTEDYARAVLSTWRRDNPDSRGGETMNGSDGPRWRKSTFSGANGGGCVEVAGHDGMILVRDTKDHGRGPVHRYTPDEWRAFMPACAAASSTWTSRVACRRRRPRRLSVLVCHQGRWRVAHSGTHVRVMWAMRRRVPGSQRS